MAGGRLWTPAEDEVLREALRENLGAKFCDIASMVTAPGQELEGRTISACVCRLGVLTGRAKNANNSEVAKQQKTIDELLRENAALKQSAAILNSTINKQAGEITKLKNSNEALQKKACDLCFAITNFSKKMKAVAENYSPFFTQEE